MDLRDINWSGRYIRVLGKETKNDFVFLANGQGEILVGIHGRKMRSGVPGKTETA